MITALLFTGFLFSQNEGGIKGTVTDKEMYNEPLLLAMVQLKDTDFNAQTNFHGNFEIANIEPGKYTLVIGYLGYETLELSVVVAENTTTEVKKSLGALSFNLDALNTTDTVLKERIEFTSKKKKNLKNSLETKLSNRSEQNKRVPH